MSLSTTSKVNISLKKLNGKAHTSNDKGLINEALPSGITMSSSTIFGEDISDTPDSTAYYTKTDTSVEYLRLPVTFINGSDTAAGRHAFEARLPDDYEANSTNPLKGIYPFKNGQIINVTKGKLQLIPTSFGDTYEAAPYYDNGSVVRIPIADERNWALDYFNGILFQDNPPATGEAPTNPAYIDVFLYIGEMLKDVIDGISGAGGGGGSGSAKIREKHIYQTPVSTNAGDNLIVTGADFRLANFDPELIDIHLNGILVAHSNELGMTEADYTIVNLNTIQMNFDLDLDDIISISIFNKSALSNSKYNEVPTGAKDGVNTIFTLSNTPAFGAMISMNGQILTPTDDSGVKDYIIAESTISMTFTLDAEDVLLATYAY
jgi:hypothetical protein